MVTLTPSHSPMGMSLGWIKQKLLAIFSCSWWTPLFLCSDFLVGNNQQKPHAKRSSTRDFTKHSKVKSRCSDLLCVNIDYTCLAGVIKYFFHCFGFLLLGLPIKAYTLLTWPLGKYFSGLASPFLINFWTSCSDNLNAKPTGVQDAHIVLFAYSAVPLKNVLLQLTVKLRFQHLPPWGG